MKRAQGVNAAAWFYGQSFGGRIPVREYTRDVPKHFDGGDIDNHGHWVGAEMGCLECHETEPMRMGITATYMLAELHCGNCGEPFAETWS